MSILIRGAKVVDESSPYHLQTLDIFIAEGKIQAIGKALQQDAATIIEQEGMCISMGWTDIFADYREPGFEQKENIQSGLAVAAAGGFTAVMVAPNTNPSVSSKSVVQYLKAQAQGNIVALHPIGAVSHQLEGKSIAEMWDMKANGAIAFSDGWKPIQNTALMLKSLEYVKAFDGTIMQIPMDANLSAGGLMHEGIVSTQLGMPGIPVIAETLHLHRDIELLRYTNSKLHVSGVSAAASVALIKNAKADGLDISCSVTPYHLALTDEVLRQYNSVYKVMPPIRSEVDRQALIAALADGTIDCVVSHHRPQDWDAKTKEFEYAAEGMNVQELAFSIALDSLASKVDLPTLVAAFANKPNALFGLQKEGIKEGAEVDCTLFNPQGQTHKLNTQSLSANNPFLDKVLPGKVIGVIRGSQIVLQS